MPGQEKFPPGQLEEEKEEEEEEGRSVTNRGLPATLVDKSAG